MFLMYSTDITYDRRPWLAWITFPAVVALSFAIAVRGDMPWVESVRLAYWIEISQLLFFIYMLSSFVILWFFGKAVCSKTGSLTYVTVLMLVAIIAACINADRHEPILWLPGCAISAITGMYLAYWPTHPIDCIFLIPPWTTFSVSGYWVVAGWVVLDVIFVAIFGWMPSLIAHPVFLLLGLFTALLLIKLRIATVYDDDYTLLQALLRKEALDPAWQDSWSVRRPQKDAEDAKDEALPLRPLTRNTAGNEDSVLCPCGCIVNIPAGPQTAPITCPECTRPIKRSTRP